MADHSPRNGLPKILTCSSTGLKELKSSFVNASEPVNFIIRLSSVYLSGIEPFELKNNLTGERLILQAALNYSDFDFMKKIMTGDRWALRARYWRLLVRCPIMREEGKWVEWEKEAIEWGMSHCQRNCVVIDFNNMDIGEGMTYKRKST